MAKAIAAEVTYRYETEYIKAHWAQYALRDDGMYFKRFRIERNVTWTKWEERGMYRSGVAHAAKNFLNNLDLTKIRLPDSLSQKEQRELGKLIKKPKAQPTQKSRSL